MSTKLSSQRTTVAASYPSRRDAEMAVDRLDDHGIDAFVRADDAGRMHPELNMVHGVHLIVLEKDAEAAREILDEAGMLFDDAPERSSEIDGPTGAAYDEAVDPGRNRLMTAVFITAGIVLVLGLLLNGFGFLW